MGYAIRDLSGAAWRKSTFSSAHGGDCVEIAPLDVSWRKSSHSNSRGGHCVETAPLSWCKSSHSNSRGGACVETAALGPHVGVRDSKNADGPALVVTEAQWQPFLAHARAHHA